MAVTVSQGQIYRTDGASASPHDHQGSQGLTGADIPDRRSFLLTTRPSRQSGSHRDRPTGQTDLSPYHTTTKAVRVSNGADLKGRRSSRDHTTTMVVSLTRADLPDRWSSRLTTPPPRLPASHSGKPTRQAELQLYQTTTKVVTQRQTYRTDGALASPHNDLGGHSLTGSDLPDSLSSRRSVLSSSS